MNKWAPCVLPGHGGHNGRLHPVKGGWRYTCGRDSRTHGLAEVWVAQREGRVVRFNRRDGKESPLAARAKEHLDCEAGILVPRHVPLEVPERTAASGRLVAERMRLFLGLRDPRWGEQPFTFTRRVIRWGGLSERQARDGIAELERQGLIRRAGWSKITEKRAAILWVLAAWEDAA